MIDFKGICKSYGGQDVLLNADFRINRSERVGLVGPNGAGKSTVFGMICGTVFPDKGEISIPSGMRIGHLKQQLEDDASSRVLLDFTADAIPELIEITDQLHAIEHELSVGGLSEARVEALLEKQGRLQHEFEHLGGYRMRSEASAALSGLGFHTDHFTRPLNSFSGGWQMRAALARVLISEPDILLLDEPSNYLDIPAIEWLYRFLRSYHGTLVLISHDRFLLKALTNITVEINNGMVNRYAGDYDYYMRERENRFKSLSAAKQNQDRRREQLEGSIARFRAKSTKASQVQSWIKELERMPEIKLPDNLCYSGVLKLPPPPSCGMEIARVEELEFSYNNKDKILSEVNLQISKGDKIAIVGYNGTGKTTLLKIIADELKPRQGKRVIGHNVVVGYQAQEFGDILPPEQSVYDVARAALPPGASLNALQSILGGFGFSGEDAYKPCKVLSGGEKIRLCFARIFVNPPNFLILDEPTTHLDIAAREGLQQALNDYQGTLCLVSHDIEFVSNVATTIIAMRPPGIRKYHGGYQYYQEKIARETGNAVEVQEVDDDDNKGDSLKERRKERARLRKELQADKKAAEKKLATVENALEQLEQQNAELMDILSANKPGTDFAEVNRNLKDVQERIDNLTVQWEAAAERLEEIMELNREIHQT